LKSACRISFSRATKRNNSMDTNLTAALVALQNSMDRKVVELRGETGDRGLPGATGATGPAGKDAKFKIGVVVQGDKAEARIREGGDNTFILDLCLPLGPQGDRGLLGLPGPTGSRGETGPSGLRGERGERGYIGEKGDTGAGLQGLKGEVGPRGEIGSQGPQGEKGDVGMTREEIQGVIIEVLSDAGVMTEQASKLIRVKTELRKALNKATSRSQAEIQDLVRKVDEIVE